MSSLPRQKNQTNEPASPSLAARFLTGLVLFYRKVLSPLKPACCRFTPTCSAYALEALRVHGAIYGSWLTLKRILRCQPFGGSGYDPVPPKSDTPRFAFKSRRTMHALVFTAFVTFFCFGIFSVCPEEHPTAGEHAPTETSAPAVPEAKADRIHAETSGKINMPTRFLIGMIHFYQNNISRFLPTKCRYTPSCSAYGITALERFGFWKGSWLTIKRLLRCNPWGGSGEDPVPEQ